MVDEYKQRVASGASIKDITNEYQTKLSNLNDQFVEVTKATGADTSKLQSITNSLSNEQQRYGDIYSVVISERVTCINNISSSYKNEISKMNDSYKNLVDSTGSGNFQNISTGLETKLSSFQDTYGRIVNTNIETL